jgi:hypothetical protein
MNRVPNSDKIIRQLSLSERIPPYPKKTFEMYLGYAYNTFIGLIYETALKFDNKYWNGEALTTDFIYNIKEFIRIFKYIKDESFDKVEFLNRGKIFNHIKPNKNKLFGDRYSYAIGTKIDGNKEMTLYYIKGDDDSRSRFRIEVKEQFEVTEYPYLKMSFDVCDDGRIEFSKRLLVKKSPSGVIMSLPFPDNYKHQPTVGFNREGVVAVRDIFAYVFEQIFGKNEVKTSHR